MSDWIVANLLVALLLAALAALAAWCRARPAVVHALWLLVLVKLVTPPIVRVPVLSASPAVIDAAPGVAPPAAIGARLLSLIDLGSRPARLPVSSPAPRFEWRSWLLALWLAGVIATLGRAAGSIRRFAGAVRLAPRAVPSLQALVAGLATRMRLRRVPDVVVVVGTVSPLLWCFGQRPRIVLPARLIERLDRPAITALLAHELAHYARRDHWLRWFELAVMAVHWWNPLAWIARRQLRCAEERCCDAWVLWALPAASRPYADALVETVAFLSETRTALPAAASGVGRAVHLQRRLTMILNRDDRRSLTAVGRCALLVVAALSLPVLPALSQDPGRSRAALERQLEQERLHLIELERLQADAAARFAELERTGRFEAALVAADELAELRDRVAVTRATLEAEPEARSDRPPESEPDQGEVVRSLQVAVDALHATGSDEEAAVVARLLERMLANREVPSEPAGLESRLAEALEHGDLERARQLQQTLWWLRRDRSTEAAADLPVEEGGAGRRDDAADQRIQRLEAKVEQLTDIVQQLIEVRSPERKVGSRSGDK